MLGSTTLVSCGLATQGAEYAHPWLILRHAWEACSQQSSRRRRGRGTSESPKGSEREQAPVASPRRPVEPFYPAGAIARDVRELTALATWPAKRLRLSRRGGSGLR